MSRTISIAILIIAYLIIAAVVMSLRLDAATTHEDRQQKLHEQLIRDSRQDEQLQQHDQRIDQVQEQAQQMNQKADKIISILERMAAED